MLRPRDCRQRSTPMGVVSAGSQLVFLGPPFAVLGAWAFYLGVQAWRRPNSRLVQSQLVEGYPTREEADPISRFLGLTRERAGPRNVTVARFLGPFNGSIFVLVGCWMTYTGLTCGPTYPSLVSAIRPLIGPLAFRFHPAMLVWVGLAVLISSMSAWRQNVTARIVWLIRCNLGSCGLRGGVVSRRHYGEPLGRDCFRVTNSCVGRGGRVVANS